MIGIIFVGTLDVCPYFDKYGDVLHRLEKPYEVILWQRDRLQRKYPKNFHVFKYLAPPTANVFRKAAGFLQYASFVRRTIDKNKYRKLVFLSTLSAFLCYPRIIMKYSGQYVLDFRDMSYEYIGLYRRVLSRIVDNSEFTCVSSKGFIPKLPSHNYVISHNFKYSEMDQRKLKFVKKSGDSPIVITHIGGGRGDEINMMYCNTFGNDPRFQLNIFGLGNDTPSMMEYVKQFNNVNVCGRYNQEEKMTLLGQTQMLLYYYPDSYINYFALANKFYDGLILRMPMIANPRSFSGKLIKEKGLGIAIELDSATAADTVYDYYQSINNTELDDCIDRMLTEVMVEDRLYVQRIEEFINTDDANFRKEP